VASGRASDPADDERKAWCTTESVEVVRDELASLVVQCHEQDRADERGQEEDHGEVCTRVRVAAKQVAAERDTANLRETGRDVEKSRLQLVEAKVADDERVLGAVAVLQVADSREEEEQPGLGWKIKVRVCRP